MDQKYEYVLLDRWVLPGTAAQVYDALVDFDLYPRWGHPGYVSGRRNGRPGVGCTGTLVVKGGLPYTATLDCTITRLLPRREIAIWVTGDLIGELVWRIRPLPDGRVELSKDWRCNTSAFMLRVLTPVLRPLFRWNHTKCLNDAIAGLTRYLSSTSPAPRREVRKSAERPHSARTAAARL